MGRDGAVVDDAATLRALRLHHPESGLRAQKRAREIDVDDVLPLLECQLVKAACRQAYAGVVEQDVHAAELLARALEQGRHRVGLGHIGRHGQGAFKAERFGLGHHGLKRLAAPSGQRDAVTGLEQRQRDCTADAGAGTGDDSDGMLVFFWGGHGCS